MGMGYGCRDDFVSPYSVACTQLSGVPFIHKIIFDGKGGQKSVLAPVGVFRRSFQDAELKTIKKRNVIVSWKGGGRRQRCWRPSEQNLLIGTLWRALLVRASLCHKGGRLVVAQRGVPPSPKWHRSWVTATIHVVVEGWTF